MGKKNQFAALAVGACLMLGTFGLAACTPENDKTGNNVPDDIFAIYTAYAESAGADAMTYDEWYAHLLETAKGDKGDDGKSAYAIWKENGHSGTEAEFLEWLKGDKGDDGANGKSAYDIWKEQDGNAGKTEAEFLEWLKGDKGDDGDVGPKGEAGTKWFTGQDAEPSAKLGAEGDFYLNTQTFNLYMKDAFGWTLLGCIKGADGKDGAGTEQTKGYQLSIPANHMEAVQLSEMMSEVKAGAYVVELDCGSATLAEDGLTAYVSDIAYGDEQTTFILSETRSQPNHNIYCGFIELKEGIEGTTSVRFNTQGAEVNASLTFKEYEMPTLKADGQPVEVPIVYCKTSDFNSVNSKFKFKIDDSVAAGQYTVTYTRLNTNTSAIRFVYENTSVRLANTTQFSGTITYKKEDSIVFLCDNNSSRRPFRLAKVALTAKS